MTLTGLCPAMGEGWLIFIPAELEDHSEDNPAEVPTLADI